MLFFSKIFKPKNASELYRQANKQFLERKKNEESLILFWSVCKLCEMASVMDLNEEWKQQQTLLS